MQKIRFSIDINASKDKVWSILWDNTNYRKWTAAFCEGSYAVSDWKEGSKVLFLSPDAYGMVSRVAAKRPNHYMSFEHLGVVKNGIEDTESDEVKAWAGATENYTLSQTNGTTTLSVEMDSTDEFKEYFMKTWPKALEQIKILSENNH
jgi:hypothetical protein